MILDLHATNLRQTHDKLMQEIPLGFGSTPRAVYLFVKQEADCCWYSLGANGAKQYIPERALTGTIQRLTIKEVETSFGEGVKADLEVAADARYIIRSGLESNFTKSLILAINACDIEMLTRPLSITVSPGDKQTVFCSLYEPVSGEWVRFDWDKAADWLGLAEKAIAKLDQAHGRGSLPAPLSQNQKPLASDNTNNETVRAVRTVTLHSPQQVLQWCKAHKKEKPEHLSSDQLSGLIEWLVLGWASANLNRPIEQLRTDYRERMAYLLSRGVSLSEAAVGWIESAQAAKV